MHLEPSSPTSSIVISHLGRCNREVEAHVQLQERNALMDACLADAPISLFLGSRTDTSQLLTIPKALIQDPAQDVAPGTSQPAGLAEGSSQQHLEADNVQRLAAFDCPAPIHDAVAFQDPPGRARILQSCVCFPTCRLNS